MADLVNVLAQLQAAGLQVDHVKVGEFTRCKVNDDKGSKKSGWYSIYEYRAHNGQFFYGGVFGNWKLHDNEGVKITSDFSGLSLAELEEVKRQQAEQRRIADQEKQQRQADAATKAARIWPGLPTNGPSLYLQNKCIAALGVRFSKGAIVVPVRRFDSDLVGLQFIYGDGAKKFLTGTAKQGAFHQIGDIAPDSTIAVCEGYATGASVHMATGFVVFVAFDAGNLRLVAQAVRARYPEHMIVVAGDNDAETAGNPGLTKAHEAAAAVGGVAIVPDFSLEKEAAA